MEINYRQAGIIVLVSILLGITYNFFSASGVSLFEYDNKKILSSELLGNGTEEPKEIGLDEAFRLYESDVIFIDAREPADYLAGHIINSINIPYEDIDNYQDALNKVPRDEPVVTYCGGTDCDLSIVLANRLNSLGFTKVFIFFGGWNQWVEAKYPVSKGKETE